ncbi:hypothetical protein HPB50_003643 [Hyalomma asiaticum]|uniref:Uncharacterized protein n=1 Tax=Hyalomma asiaticum TaxID=266040 RepID=A0ACB7SE67_HYAAI|nr:hypothetical protein HPB50_003643 [Hyalomma asiaticum]
MHDISNTGRLRSNAVPRRLSGVKKRRDSADSTHSRFVQATVSDIHEFLVLRTTFITREQLKSRKALERHNCATIGWVREPSMKKVAADTVIVVTQHTYCWQDRPTGNLLADKSHGCAHLHPVNNSVWMGLNRIEGDWKSGGLGRYSNAGTTL